MSEPVSIETRVSRNANDIEALDGLAGQVDGLAGQLGEALELLRKQN